MSYTEKKETRVKLELVLPIKVGMNVANTKITFSLSKEQNWIRKYHVTVEMIASMKECDFIHAYPISTSMK